MGAIDSVTGLESGYDLSEFTYGRPMKGHSWHAFIWGEMVRRMADHVRRNAPAGEDTSAWNY